MPQEHSSHCPLHTSTAGEIINIISTETLTKRYRRDLGIDISLELSNAKTLVLHQCPLCKLQFFTPAKEGSSEFYQQMKQLPWYYPNTKFEYNSAAEWLKNTTTVLDIGCGDGRFANHLPQCSYTGLEPYSVEKRPLPNQHNIIYQSLNDHAHRHTEHYEAVCAFQVLEHVKNPALFIGDALKCLQPGGLLILGVPNADSYLSRLVNFTLNAPPHHLSWWQKETFQHCAKAFTLKTLALQQSPVEDWEKRLYWMANATHFLSPGSTPHFSDKHHWQIISTIAYISAGLLQYLPIKKSSTGSTLLWVAQKQAS